MRRIVIISLVAAVGAAACGGGTEEGAADAATTTSTTLTETTEATATTEGSTTTTDGSAPAEFTLGEDDNGATVTVRPGDAITMRLPVEDPADPQWILAKEPDSAILQIVDSLLWIPSEPGAGEIAFEFVFFVVGTGRTDLTFSLGPVTPTSRTIGFTVESG